jgi:glutamate 5-kinase
VTTFVVKVGSSVVADDRGELRLGLLEALCDEVARRHEAGDEVVVVTSGAIARGRSCRRRRRSGRASSTATTTSCSKPAG